VDKIDPASGALEGGTKVTMTGDSFRQEFQYYFGENLATGVNCSSKTCTMVTPFHKPASVDVIVKSPAGPSNTIPYQYLAPAIKSFTPKVGPTTGGLSVYLTGVSLSDNMTVNFGSTFTKKVKCGGTSTDCAIVSASGSVDTPVSLTVSIDGFTSAPTENKFSFVNFPVLTGINPGSGITGAPVTFKGNYFSTVPGETTFTFSGVPATGVTCNLSTQCTGFVPGMATQTVYVLVTVNGYTSLTGIGFTNTARIPPPPPK
jgi:hypothetical protein